MQNNTETRPDPRLQSTDLRVRVPEVVVRLIQGEGSSSVQPRQRIVASIARPDDETRRPRSRSTRPALLHNSLTELLRAAGMAVARCDLHRPGPDTCPRGDLNPHAR
ncbi:MAG: hypothetical protein QOF53_962 [Nocardioidaceae bacterium]|nr:hypothetical protein [Nocardioidaceae bacterium]